MELKVFLATIALMAAATSVDAATNLVVNGDFSDGNVGFTSQYKYVAPRAGALMPETRYTIASDPRAVHPYWVSMSGDNPMLLVNGATGRAATVWQETVNTIAGQTYEFTASAADVCCNKSHQGRYAPSELEFEVSANNFATFKTLATIDTAPPGDAGDFHTATADFTASGSVEIRVVDGLTGRVGNDFALDDIGVFAVSGSGGSSPVGVSEPSGVPEPQSWALMITGFAAVGAAVRASRRRALRLA